MKVSQVMMLISFPCSYPPRRPASITCSSNPRAPGVIDADGQIRPGDEVIIRGSHPWGLGKAKMSGWEMMASRRSVAVELRHIRER